MPEFMQLKWENPWEGKTKPCCLRIPQDPEYYYRKYGSYTECMATDSGYGALPEFKAWCKAKREECHKDVLSGECKTEPCWLEMQDRPCTDEMVTKHRRCGGVDGKTISSLVDPSQDKLAKGYQSPEEYRRQAEESNTPPPPPERFVRWDQPSSFNPSPPPPAEDSYGGYGGYGGHNWYGLDQTKEKVHTQKASQGWIGDMPDLNKYYAGAATRSWQGAGCSGCSSEYATRYSVTKRFKNNCGCSEEDLECQSICNRRYARCGRNTGYVDPRTGVRGFTGNGNGE